MKLSVAAERLNVTAVVELAFTDTEPKSAAPNPVATQIPFVSAGEKLTVQAVGAPLPGATVNTFSFPLIVGLPPPQLVSVGRVVEVKLNRPGTFRAPDDEVVTGVAAHPTAIPELG